MTMGGRAAVPGGDAGIVAAGAGWADAVLVYLAAIIVLPCRRQRYGGPVAH